MGENKSYAKRIQHLKKDLEITFQIEILNNNII